MGGIREAVVIFTFSKNTHVRRYGEFCIRQDYPPKGILLEGKLQVLTEKELGCVVREMWAAFRDYEGQIELEDEEDTERLLEEALDRIIELEAKT